MTWFNDVGLLHYHASLLADADRVDRLHEAIHAVVRPGDIVVDVGTGTGVLAYFACQAGAARVFAIEEGPVVNLARELARVNGFDDRVEFFGDRSYRVELPERADVLISETLWNFGVGEGMVGVLADARRRFLKPDARSIPVAVELHVAAVQNHRVYQLLGDRPRDRHGIDFSPIRHCQLNNVQMPHLHSDDFLAPPAQLLSSELDESAATDFDADVAVIVTRGGVMQGIGGWFRCWLTPEIALDNEPPSVTSSWAHAFFPVQKPIAVAPGDEISMRIASSAEGSIWRWRIGARRGGVVRAAYDQTSADGFPSGPRTHGRGARPQPTVKGEVVAWVLEAMDGTREIGALEAGVRERFGSRFTDPEDAVQLVRETVRTLGR
ncbi:MAG TPA: 50S ribosomal protein L11 methyltransferase [Solirubrobacteraceae bacterium]|nr:50S ribosomal protein L11 methyltransferase [Solirubrobacteraceae bacterium]